MSNSKSVAFCEAYKKRSIRSKQLLEPTCLYVRLPIRYPSGDYRCSIHGIEVFLFITFTHFFVFFLATTAVIIKE